MSPASGRRLAAESFVVVLAVAAVTLLRRRGLAGGTPDASGAGGIGVVSTPVGSGPAGTLAGGGPSDLAGTAASAPLAGVDPLLSAVPVLVCAAAGLVLLRCYPLLLRAVARLPERSRGLVAFLGAARAARERPAGDLAVLVVLLAAGLAVFSAVLGTSIERAQERAGWERVAGDGRIEGVALTDDQVRSVAGRPGVRAVAAVHVAPDARLVTTTAQVRVVAVSEPQVAAVLGGSPVDPRLPAALNAADAGGGTGPAALPALVTPELAPVTGSAPLRVEVAGTQVPVRVVGSTQGWPGQPAGPTIVLPLAGLRAAVGPAAAPNLLLLAGPGLDDAALRATADALAPGLAVTSRADVLRQLRSGPFVTAVTRTFAVGLLVYGAAAALALVLTVVATARSRARMLAYLRTLGLSPRAARVLVAVELAPAAAVALAGGLAVGLVLPRLLGPAVDLRAFAAGVPPGIAVDAVRVAALYAAILALGAALVLLVTILSRRLGPGRALRAGSAG